MLHNLANVPKTRHPVCYPGRLNTVPYRSRSFVLKNTMLQVTKVLYVIVLVIAKIVWKRQKLVQAPHKRYPGPGNDTLYFRCCRAFYLLARAGNCAGDAGKRDEAQEFVRIFVFYSKCGSGGLEEL